MPEYNLPPSEFKRLVRQLNGAAYSQGVADERDSWKQQEKYAAQVGELQSKIDAAIEAYAQAAVDAERARGWISVEDRLPENARRVLACNPLGYVGAAQYHAGHWNGIGGANGWMELPPALATPPLAQQDQQPKDPK